jgi:hypothetical protein
MSSGSSTHSGGGRIPRLYTPKPAERRPSPPPDRFDNITPAVLLPGLAALAASALAASFALAPCAFVVLAADLADAVDGLRGRDARALERAGGAACVVFITLRAVVARRPWPLVVLVLLAGPWRRRRALAALILAAAAYDVWVDGFVVRRWPLAVGVFVAAHVVNVARTYRRSKYG